MRWSSTRRTTSATRASVRDPDDPESRSRYYRLFDLIGGARRRQARLHAHGDADQQLAQRLPPPRRAVHADATTRYFARTPRRQQPRWPASNAIDQGRSREQVGDDAPSPSHIAEAAGAPRRRPAVQRPRRAAQPGVRAARARSRRRATRPRSPSGRTRKVADYSVRKTYGKLLDMVETAFEKEKPLFALPIYYPLAYYRGPTPTIDPIEENRQAQVVGLIRTNFLKRFESSVYAFERSCDRLLRKLLAFVAKNNATPPRAKPLRALDRPARRAARVRPASPARRSGATTTSRGRRRRGRRPARAARSRRAARPRRVRRARDLRRDLPRPRPDRRVPRRGPHDSSRSTTTSSRSSSGC